MTEIIQQSGAQQALVDTLSKGAIAIAMLLLGLLCHYLANGNKWTMK